MKLNNIKRILALVLILASKFCFGQIVVDTRTEPGTEQVLPCSFYSDYTLGSIEYFLTKDHLKSKRRELGMSGLDMSDVTPVSNPVSCQKIRDLIDQHEKMRKPAPKEFMDNLIYTPHFYKVGNFYMVVYQPSRLTMTRNNIYIINSSFEYIGAATI